ncbi:MAG: YdcF family protein [Lachnospiraceae bacterium]|nr:YdcF family protein [Lachnospiraceae bacterium]
MNLFWGLLFSLLGIISMIYGVALALGAHGSLFFVIWFVFGILLIIDGVIRIFGIPSPFKPSVTSRLLLVLRILVAFIALLFLIVEGMILSRFNTHTDEDVDYLIVAGAQVYENGPSPVLKFRLDAALEYLRIHPDTVCIVTGGKGSNEIRPEAVIMAEYLVNNGIDSDRIILEDRSSNTTGNMKNAAALFDAKNSTAAIVTNNFHLFRSMRIAKKQGIQNVSGIAAGSTPLFLPNNLLREFCGVCKDFLFGNM